jgi:hypothetical protein
VRAARPRLHKAPVDWWAYRQAYREAISAMTRRAAGKAPRTQTETTRFRRMRWLAQGAGFAVVPAMVWFYAGFWWSFWLAVALVVSWLAMFMLWFRRLPLD